MIHLYLLSTLALLLVGLSLWLLTRYQSAPAIRYYAGFLFGLAILATVSGLLYISPDTMTVTLTRVGYIAGIWTFSMLLVFSWFFPSPSPSTPTQSNLFWLLPLAFFIPLILWSPDFVVGAAVSGSGTIENHGSLFILFPIFVMIYVVWSFVNLLQKITGAKSARADLVTFSWVLMVATVLGVIFDVILPASGHSRIPVGIYSSSILFALTTSIVARK